jgi:GH25 family lysozyme M1 (1,4-beta-N-acetylmuramidase)
VATAWGMARVTMFSPVVHDLAHFNNCNFSQFKAGGGLGVIHKASQAAIDDRVARRLPLIKAVGLLAGCYHFNQVGHTPLVQAQLFLSSIKAAGFEPSKDLVALDWEPPAISLADVLAFMDLVEQALGHGCVLYGGSVIKAQMPRATAAQRDAFARRRLWLSQYGPAPRMLDVNHEPLPWTKPWLWQYTGDGVGPEPHQMPGTAHGADLNVFDGTAEELCGQWAG